MGKRFYLPFAKQIAVVTLLSILLNALATSASADDEAWENGKAYTAMLKDEAAAALALVAAAASAVKLAAADVEKAKAALDAADKAATSAAALEALAGAEAALATAEATLAAATTAAEIALAVATGATVGTLLGQGLRGLWSWCWDPVCDLTDFSSGPGPIYFPATTQEIDALLPQLLSEIVFTDEIDFVAAGDTGLAAKNFISDGVGQFMGAARAAAAMTDGRPSEVRIAICDLQRDLRTYRVTILNFSHVLAATGHESPLAELLSAREAFDAAVAQTTALCSPAAGDNCVAIAAALSDATRAFQDAEDRVAAAVFSPLVGGSSPLFPDLSLAEFDQFLENCALLGESCLPDEEILLADKILKAAGTFFPSMPSFGPAIAQYDAEGGDIGGREGALFDSGTLNLAELLSRSATTLSPSGNWLNIDLQQSPLARQAEANPADCSDCNKNGSYDTIDIATARSKDINENSTPDECEKGTVVWIFEGTAQGGQVSAVIDGFFATCSVTIGTAAGDSAESVARDFAAALNLDPCLSTQGITAAVFGSTVTISGFTLSHRDIRDSITDPGLNHEVPILTIPTLSTWGFLVMLILLSIFAVELISYRRRSEPHER